MRRYLTFFTLSLLLGTYLLSTPAVCMHQDEGDTPETGTSRRAYKNEVSQDQEGLGERVYNYVMNFESMEAFYDFIGTIVQHLKENTVNENSQKAKIVRFVKFKRGLDNGTREWDELGEEGQTELVEIVRKRLISSLRGSTGTTARDKGKEKVRDVEQESTTSSSDVVVSNQEAGRKNFFQKSKKVYRPPYEPPPYVRGIASYLNRHNLSFPFSLESTPLYMQELLRITSNLGWLKKHVTDEMDE